MDQYFQTIPPAVLATLPHDNKIGAVIGTAALCMTLAVIAVSLRLYTRKFMLKQVGIDDYMAALSLVGMVIVAIIQFLHSQHGLGRHLWDLSSDEISGFLMYFWFGLVFYNITLLFIKLTLFFQYFRIIEQVDRYRRVYIGLMTIVVSWTLAQIFVMIFTCSPVAGYWDISLNPTCLPEVKIQTVNAIGNMITDVIVLLLPMPVVWKLSLKKAQKLALMGIFGLGFFTCVISMLRLVFMREIGVDISYDAVAITSWSQAELTTAIICSAMPALRPLMSRIFPSLGVTARSSRGYRRQSGSNAGSGDRESKLGARSLTSKKTDTSSQTELRPMEPRTDV
ncbi:hypothetical protein GGR56DRAFT_688849 [Xylariaceae sp. FL0804]|nr:hypothetical protein GGR56DRAFT_688849 [Xylariaceae sp. FL0804]